MSEIINLKGRNLVEPNDFSLQELDSIFDLADKIRNELLDKGIKLNDTREGTTYEVI